MKLLFIRHGQTETNVQGLTHKLNDDISLSDEGKRQVQCLVKVIKANNIEKIFSSPEKRAADSGEILANATNKPLEIVISLHERNWGEWEGRAWEEIKQELEKMSLEERYNFIPPGGESWVQMEKRLKEALNLLVSENVGSIAVITHMGVLRGLMPILTGQPKQSSFKYDFENASVTTFKYDGTNFQETLVNDTSHLV